MGAGDRAWGCLLLGTGCWHLINKASGFCFGEETDWGGWKGKQAGGVEGKHRVLWWAMYIIAVARLVADGWVAWCQSGRDHHRLRRTSVWASVLLFPPRV